MYYAVQLNRAQLYAYANEKVSYLLNSLARLMNITRYKTQKELRNSPALSLVI
jgi:hypothetical protein